MFAIRHIRSDGDYQTICASTGHTNPWLSVQLPANISAGDLWSGVVSITNRPKFVHGYSNSESQVTYQRWLSPFEVHVGHYFGDVASNRPCGGGPISVPTDVGPFTVRCERVVGQYVTLRLAGPSSAQRFVTVAEIEVYLGSTPVPPGPVRALAPPSPPGRRLARSSETRACVLCARIGVNVH